MEKEGNTLAPFNTTQFIMEEHKEELPKLDCKYRRYIKNET